MTTSLSIAERKEKLIAEGALYRTAVLQSKHVLQAGLQPASLARHVLNQIVMAACQLFMGGGAGAKNLHVQTLLPVLLGGISALSRKSLWKPIVRGAVLLGVAGVVARFMARKNESRGLE